MRKLLMQIQHISEIILSLSCSIFLFGLLWIDADTFHIATGLLLFAIILSIPSLIIFIKISNFLIDEKYKFDDGLEDNKKKGDDE